MMTLKVSSLRMYLFGDEVRARTDFLELGNITWNKMCDVPCKKHTFRAQKVVLDAGPV